MRANSKHRIASVTALSSLVVLFWILSAQSLGLASIFDSPLDVPTSEHLTFQSPLLDSTLETSSSSPLPRFPWDDLESGAREFHLPTLDTFQSPLAVPLEDLEPRSYLPLALRNYPLPLLYGPKGLAGQGSAYLFGESYDAYYTWAINPDQTDVRFARMVLCVTDYHLYGYYGGPNFQEKISEAAQADSGKVAGRVWLVFNEPDDYVGTPNTGGQCGVWPFTGDPFDLSNQSPRVRDDPAEAAARYSLIYDWIKDEDPNAKVFAGGLLRIYSTHTRNWWTIFLNTLASRNELYKVEGVHVHSYPDWSTGWECMDHYCMPEMAQQLNTWYNNYHVGKGLGNRPIWITETGAGDCGWYGYTRWDPEGHLKVLETIMRPMTWWFTDDPQWPHSSVPTNPGYDSIHWYTSWWKEGADNFWCTFLEDSRSSPSALTSLGAYWRDYNLRP